MAFQIILQKLVIVERAMQAIPPLLKKIVDQLEAQSKQTEAEVATYEQLYPELPVEEAPTSLPDVRAANPLPTRPPRRWWRWFVKEQR
jgi:hypothetical protein